MYDNRNMDADMAIRFWSESPDLRFAENGEFFANRDSILLTLRNYYAHTDTMDLEWLHKDISPISENLALMAGTFKYRLVFEDGSDWAGVNVLTATFIKENGRWSILQGHESTKAN